MKNFVFLFTLLFSLIYAQTADFLIVENPAALTIYNKYQQSISSQVQNQLSPFTPFQIIEENEMLSDQISHASRVILNGNTYFILKDEEGNFVSDETEYSKIFKNCELFGDTINIFRNNRVSIFSKPEYLVNKKRHRYLEENRYCLRMFRYKNLYYLKVPGDSVVYGWTQLPQTGWEVSHETLANLEVIPDHLISRLKIRIDAANQDYENFFSYFKKKYNVNFNIPYWHMEISDYEIKGILNDPTLADNLKYSNRYLMQDIDNIFLGSEFMFVYSDSTFYIKPGNKRR
ncbi:MAG: hypothetical protein JW956_12455 [Calditrichaceae bacterium]|nr:hypothetical protein [Calditrichaceae bacterium]